MRGPSLQKATIISFALHLTVFLVAIVVLKHSSRMVMPAAYTVSIVSPDVLKGIDKSTDIEADTGRNVAVLKEARELQAPAVQPKKSIKDIAKEKEMVDKKISAIAAKKKIERLVKLRSIISLKATGDKRSSNAKAASPSQGNGTFSDNYYTKITKEIWQQWVYPDTGKKDIEAIIAVKILRDGTALVQKIEKSSGNALFDKSAIRALAKASPLSPPPYEMEIGVRFYP
jgi:colicin import membrane protein